MKKMTMNEIGMLGLSFFVGLGVGVSFYMGLWWTILLRFSSNYLVLWWWMSFLVRIIAAASIFYLVANEHIARYAMLLVGFMLSRKIIVKLKTSG
jgi:F1F0 ATPase subunit 2